MYQVGARVAGRRRASVGVPVGAFRPAASAGQPGRVLGLPRRLAGFQGACIAVGSPCRERR